MSGPWKRGYREHRRPRFLPNEIRETPSIPVRHVRTDVLLDQGHAVLPSPASRSPFRRGGGPQSRGVTISAIARVEGIAWNTVARWLEHAADVCLDFNQSRLAGFVVEKLQADEIRSFVGGKTRPAWIFVAIEVWSRLWPSTVTGRRSYRNTEVKMSKPLPILCPWQQNIHTP